MIVVATVLLGFLAIGTALIVRERRHRPLNFQRYFPAFKATLATHRGYGKHGPIAENTLPAFAASEKLGFRAHELDVRRTADGQIVLFHGPRLEDTTDRCGRVEDNVFADIRKVDAAHYLNNAPDARKDRHAPKRTAIATLSEVLAATSKHSTLNIEIKRDRWDLSSGVEDLTVRTVTLENAAHRVYFSGFHFLTLWNLRRYRSGIPIGLLVEPGRWAALKLHIYRFLLLPDNIHLHYSTATPERMAKLKRRGYGLAFWTVNDENIARGLFDNGADVVITDRMDFHKRFANRQPATVKRRAILR